jgi:hypothetical protein
VVGESSQSHLQSMGYLCDAFGDTNFGNER